MSIPRYVFWQSEADGLWYFHLKSGNGKVLHGSEAYAKRANCLAGIRACKRSASRALIKEQGAVTVHAS